jgi:hypothetical protein
MSPITRFRTITAAAAILAVLAIAGPASAATELTAQKRGDRLWTHPAYAEFRVDRIALLPAVTYGSNLEAEKLVDRAVGAAFAGTGYRWVAPLSARYLMRAVAGNDSAMNAIRAGVRKRARVDSLEAPRTCARLRCDAVLSVLVDHWEQHAVEWNQSGKPSTTVRLKLALVDSTGALLWTAEGTQTAEGPYHNPQAAPLGVSESGLERKPITGQGGPPSFEQVLDSLVDRWTSRFPRTFAADTTRTGTR